MTAASASSTTQVPNHYYDECLHIKQPRQHTLSLPSGKTQFYLLQGLQFNLVCCPDIRNVVVEGKGKADVYITQFHDGGDGKYKSANRKRIVENGFTTATFSRIQVTKVIRIDCTLTTTIGVEVRCKLKKENCQFRIIQSQPSALYASKGGKNIYTISSTQEFHPLLSLSFSCKFLIKIS